MTAAIAAFRAGNAPHILQVFEVGTATMMASKGAIVPVGKVMADSGLQVRSDGLHLRGRRLLHRAERPDASLPFNSSTTVFHFNKDAFTARPGSTRTSRRRPGRRSRSPRPSSRPSGTTVRSRPAGSGWTQLESFSTWHNTLFATQNNGFGGISARLAFNSPLHVRHIENLANMSKQGLFIYKRPRQQGRCNLPVRRVRDDDRLVVDLHGAIKKQREVRLRHRPAALLPGCARHPAEHRDRRRERCGSCRARSRPSTRGWPPFFNYLTNAEMQAASHQRTGYLPVTLAAVRTDREVGLLQEEPGRRHAR